MTDEILGEIDEVLAETLGDIENTTAREAAERSGLTIGGTGTESDRDAVVDEQLDRLADELELSDGTVRLAQSLRDQYLGERGDFIGAALEVIAAACLYCAAKTNEEGVGPSDVVEADETGVTRKGLLRRSKDVAAKVGMEPSAFLGSEQFVERYGEELGLPDRVRDRATEIVRTLADVGADSGKSPTGWAAAAVYVATTEYDISMTQSAIAEAANCSEVTIRNRYKEQEEALREVESIPSDPHDIVNHVVERTVVGPDTRTVAHELLERVVASNIDTESEPLLWALAAVRRAGELLSIHVGIRMLSRFTPADTDEIQSRRRDLMGVLRSREARQLVE